jgi:folate-dependent phosphoribosylglycinamide formyltransferase PurN
MKSKDELVASQWGGEPLNIIEENVAKAIGAHSVTYLPLEEAVDAVGGEIGDFYSYYFGGLHPFRSKQYIFPKRKQKKINSIKVILMIKDDINNVLGIINHLGKRENQFEIIDVISNLPNNSIIQKTKQKTQVNYIPSNGALRNYSSRKEYEKKILNYLQDKDFDILFLIKWPLIFSYSFLFSLKQKGITILNVCPSYIHPNDIAMTSRGKIEVIRGLYGDANALKRNYPVSGITVHQVLPGNKVNVGPVILQEEIRILPTELLHTRKKRVRNVESRVIPTALNRVIHILQNNIDVSSGTYPW